MRNLLFSHLFLVCDNLFFIGNCNECVNPFVCGMFVSERTESVDFDVKKSWWKEIQHRNFDHFSGKMQWKRCPNCKILNGGDFWASTPTESWAQKPALIEIFRKINCIAKIWVAWKFIQFGHPNTSEPLPQIWITTTKLTDLRIFLNPTPTIFRFGSSLEFGRRLGKLSTVQKFSPAIPFIFRLFSISNALCRVIDRIWMEAKNHKLMLMVDCCRQTSAKCDFILLVLQPNCKLLILNSVNPWCAFCVCILSVKWLAS